MSSACVNGTDAGGNMVYVANPFLCFLVVIGKGATVGPKAMVSSDVKDGEEQW